MKKPQIIHVFVALFLCLPYENNAQQLLDFGSERFNGDYRIITDTTFRLNNDTKKLEMGYYRNRIYNDDKNIVYIISITPSYNGIDKYFYEYDSKGRRTKDIIWYNASVSNKKNIYKYRYNDTNNTIIQSSLYYGFNGQESTETISKFNEKGYITESVTEKHGSYFNIYNDTGHLIEKNQKEKDKEIRPCFKYKYDNNGNMIEEVFYIDVGRRRKIHKLNYVYSEFDFLNNWQKRECYDDGKLSEVTLRKFTYVDIEEEKSISEKMNDSLMVNSILQNDSIMSVYHYLQTMTSRTPRYEKVEKHLEALLSNTQLIEQNKLTIKIDSIIFPFLFQKDVLPIISDVQTNFVTELNEQSTLFQSEMSSMQDKYLLKMWLNEKFYFNIYKGKIGDVLSNKIQDSEVLMEISFANRKNKYFATELVLFAGDSKGLYINYKNKWYLLNSEWDGIVLYPDKGFEVNFANIYNATKAIDTKANPFNLKVGMSYSETVNAVGHKFFLTESEFQEFNKSFGKATINTSEVELVFVNYLLSTWVYH